MNLYEHISKGVDQIIAKYKSAQADGQLTFSEAGRLFCNAVATVVELLQKFSEYEGAEKKAAALQAIEQLYGELIAPIDLAGVPNLLEPVADRAIKAMLMSFADPLIDSLVNIFNKTDGWDDRHSPGLLLRAPADAGGACEFADSFTPF